MKKVIAAISIVLWGGAVFGQESALGFFEDALLLSSTDYALGSSARMQAIGGASVALGGDISSAVSNPAGLGFFNKGVFTFSPSLDFSTTTTDFSISEGQLISRDESFRNNFHIANVGAVINWNKGRFTEDKFKGGSLAISISRNRNFHLDRRYQGRNTENSVIDYYASDFGGGLGELAFDQYLVDEVLVDFNGETVATGYQPYYQGDGGRSPWQSETIKERGAGYATTVAWGGNYDDWLYFGGGIGFQTANYERTTDLQEDDYLQTPNGTPDVFLNSVNQYSRLSFRGAGVDFNAGVTVRPFPFLTLGASYVSPTFYTVNTELITDLTVDWQEGTFREGVDVGGLYTVGLSEPTEYTLRTAAKWRAGAALFLGKRGFVTGDIEFIDHTQSTINSNDFFATEDNLAIDTYYRPAFNVKIGGEYRIAQLHLRGGYAMNPSPYKNSDLGEVKRLTFGIGYRTLDYFLDLAVVNTQSAISYAPYFTADGFQPLADTDLSNTSVTATLGFNF